MKTKTIVNLKGKIVSKRALGSSVGGRRDERGEKAVGARKRERE